MDAILVSVEVTTPEGVTVTYTPQVGVPVPGPGLPEAPQDGTTYGRNNAAWVAVGAPGGGDITGYLHTQSSALSTWTINHNLGYRPSCTLRDNGGTEYEADISHPNVNQTVVTHVTPTAGFAWLI